MPFDRDAAFASALKLAEAPPPEAPPADPAAAPVIEEPADEGHLEPVTPAAETPPPPPKVEAKPPPKDFEQIAREKVAERQRKEAEKGTQVEQARAAALLEAAKKGDAMMLLTAAGIPWNAAAKQVLEGKVEAPAAEAKPDDLRTEVEQLRAQLNQQNAARVRETFVTKAAEMAKADPKFKFTTGLNAAPQAMAFVERYYSQTGELPGKDMDESIQMGLEHVENQLAREAERYRPLLQPVTGSVTPAKQAVPPSSVSKTAPKQLTNDDATGGKPVPASIRQPKTQEDYFQDALQQWKTLQPD